MTEKKPSRLSRWAKQYILPGTFVSLNTPIHEGIHAVTAEVLPKIDCTGITLDPAAWYTPALDLIGGSYIESAEMGVLGAAKIAGQAAITYQDNTLGHLSAAATSILPEFVALTVGFYFAKSAINGIAEKGKKMYSTFMGFCSAATIAGSQFYYTNSIGSGTGDHTAATQSFLRAFGAENVDFLATPLTAVTVAGMMASTLYLANKIPVSNGETLHE